MGRIRHPEVDVEIRHADCLDIMATMGDSTVDSIVTDPPYGLEFMGKGRDGADGFRRALNLADTGRESVFGRTSRTSPEYRAGHPYEDWCRPVRRGGVRGRLPAADRRAHRPG